MANVCEPLSPEVLKALNSLTKTYKDSGLKIEDARAKATQEIYDYLLKPTEQSVEVETNTFEDIDEQVIEQDIQEMEESSILGSTQDKTTQAYATESSEILTINNVYSVFQKLAAYGHKIDSALHSNHLDELMRTLVVPVFDSLNGLTLNILAGDKESFGKVALSLDEKTVQEINLVYAKNPTMQDLSLSMQEVAAHEFVHAITVPALRHGSYVLRKGVRDLYDLAASKLTWQDFKENPNTPEDVAKARYDYIFNNPNGKGLAEFVAFGNTNEHFANKLKTIQIVEKSPRAKNLHELIVKAFRQAVAWVMRRTTHTQGTNVADALISLTYELAGLRTKNKNLLDRVSDGIEFGKSFGSGTVDLIMKPLTTYAKNKNASGKPNFVTNVVTLWNYDPNKGQKAFRFGSALAETVNNIIKHREYFFANLFLKLPQELFGENETNANWHKLLRVSKHIVDGARHKMKEATILNVRESFIGDFDDETKEAYTEVALYTDLDDLLVHSTGENVYTFADIRKLLDSEQELNTAIAKEEALLTRFGNIGNAYIAQSRGLGMFMVRKETPQLLQQSNAYQIANVAFDYRVKRPDNWQDAIPTIQRLKTLHALRFVNPNKKALVLKSYDREFVNPDENGFINLLSLNSRFKRESLSKLFHNNPSLMSAGYTKDLNPPDIMVRFSSKKNDKDLIDAGFVFKGRAPKSTFDPNQSNQYIYVAAHNGLVPYSKMITSLTSRQVAGTTLADIRMQNGLEAWDAYQQAESDTAKIIASINPAQLYSLNIDESKTTTLIPIVNPDGNIVGFRYVMKERTRQEIFKNRDTRVDNIMGAMYESLTDKVASLDINNQVVDELIKEHKTLYQKNPKGFIRVNDKHPKYGEIYELLPKEMKQRLEEYFGVKGILVRESMMDIIFGYRKYSWVGAGMNSWVTKALKTVIMGLLRVSPNKFYRGMRFAEQGWQEFIQELKTTIVLKTRVLLDNIISNMIISLMHGVPLNYLLKKQAEATIAVENYINQHRRKLILEQKLDTIGISKEAKDNYKAKIKEIEFDLNTSPIKELVGEGLLNSIVEDVTIEDTDFGIKGEFTKLVASKTRWIPEPVKAGISQLQIAKSTGFYKFLEKTTRYSDFVARHALYSWYTQEKRMPSEEALKLVIEQFINYDLPTSKELQYLNDMGLYMFTKYAIRIQKTIYRLLKNKPKSYVALLALESLTGEVSDPSDTLSFGFGLPNNPFNSVDEMMMPAVQMFGDVTGVRI